MLPPPSSSLLSRPLVQMSPEKDQELERRIKEKEEGVSEEMFTCAFFLLLTSIFFLSLLFLLVLLTSSFSSAGLCVGVTTSVVV